MRQREKMTERRNVSDREKKRERGLISIGGKVREKEGESDEKATKR